VVLAAKTDRDAGSRGVSLFLVDTRTPGFTRGRNLEKVGQHAADTSELFFDDMRIPASALLGERARASRMMMQELPRERLVVGIQAMGLAKGARDLAVRYVQEREAFGQPIARLQKHALHAGAGANRDRGLRGLHQRLRRGLCARELSGTAASAFKLHASEMAGRVADACLQLFAATAT